MDLPLTVSRPELLVAGSDSKFRDTVQSLMLFAERIGELRDLIGAELGISGAQYTVLTTLWRLEADKGVRIGRLASELEVRMPTVTVALKALVKAGLVERRADETDGRSFLVRVSGEGERRLRALAPQLQAINDKVFGDLDQSAFLVFAATLGKIERNLADAFAQLRGPDEADR